jgi:hypothetical protein
LSLQFRPDGHGPQAVPAVGGSIDLNGGEGDISGELAVSDGDQRERQGVTVTEAFDEVTLSQTGLAGSRVCPTNDVVRRPDLDIDRRDDRST